MIRSERLSYLPGYAEVIYNGTKRMGYIFDLKGDQYYGVAVSGERFQGSSVLSVKEKLIPHIETLV